MPVELVAAIVAGIAIAVVAMGVRVSGPTVQTLGGMFRAPDLGWPSGVQEDDELHWSWAATGARSATQPDEPAEADWQELDPSTLRLTATPLLRHRHP